MLPAALLFEASEEALDQAVLLRDVGRDELLREAVVATGGAEAAALERSYLDPLESSLRTAVGRIVDGLEGAILDGGCGGGLHGRRDVIGLDMSFPLARAFPGMGIVGDAADPPFEAESFDAVLLLNVLDSTRSPRLVLGQANALLRSGGKLIISARMRGTTRSSRRRSSSMPPRSLAPCAASVIDWGCRWTTTWRSCRTRWSGGCGPAPAGSTSTTASSRWRANADGPRLRVSSFGAPG